MFSCTVDESMMQGWPTGAYRHRPFPSSVGRLAFWSCQLVVSVALNWPGAGDSCAGRSRYQICNVSEIDTYP